MKEPSPRTSRLALTAGIAAFVVVGGGGFLLGQRTVRQPPPATAMTPAPIAPTPTPSPGEATARTIDRAALLSLASAAADAASRGAAMPAALTDSVGRSFSIALPFGCEGPANEQSEASMRWRYDAETQALRLHAAPVAWSPSDWWEGAPPADVETIEGFWIPRPWSTSEACPATRAPAAADGAEPITLPGQTLAIGHAFGSDGARQGRRDGQAYTAVLRTAADAISATKGYHLRLRGRIVAVPAATPRYAASPAVPNSARSA